MTEIPVTKAIVRNTNGDFLVVKDRESGKWELPGGRIEEGEDRFNAAARELQEETSLEPEGFQDVVRLELESDRAINCYVVFTEDFTGEPQAGGDVTETRWVRAEEFVELDHHRDSAYNIVPMLYLDEYLETAKDYGSGEEIDVTKVLLRNEDGRFLAVKKTSEEKVHSGHKYTLYGRMAGKWKLPGGRFKGSSDRFEAAKRELEEELGIDIGKAEDVVREEIEEENTVNVYILLVDDWEGDIKLSKEHQDFRWVTPKEYLKMDWHQGAGYRYPPMEFLEDYLSKDKNY